MFAGPLRRGILFALLVLCVVAPARAGQVVVYDAGGGTLPEANGWSYFDFAPGVPAPADSAGLLLPRTTGHTDTRFWQRLGDPVTFSGDFSMDITMRVISSDYIPDVGDGTQRSGFYFEVDDSLGHRLALGISAIGLTVNTDRTLSPSNGIPLVPFATGGGLHDFEVDAISDTLVLRIDGTRVGACPIGDPFLVGNPSDVYFGDGSNAAGSTVEVVLVRYGNYGEAAGVKGTPVVSGTGFTVSAMGMVGAGGVDFAMRSIHDGSARVRIFDLGGRRLAELGAVSVHAGTGRVHWSGTDDAGRPVPAGVYFISAAGTAGHGSCKAVVVR